MSARKTPAKSRNFTFTNFNLDFDYQLFEDLKYVRWGVEKCPTSGRMHHQGWCSFKNQRSGGKRALAGIGKIVGGGAHVEVMLGSLAQNEQYCKKDGQYFEIGEAPKQGERTDILAQVDRIKAGTSVETIAMETPMMYHQYGRTLEKIETIAKRKRYRTEMTVGVWYHGPTLAGKSHLAFEGFDPDTHFVKCLEDQWWDGYEGQETVIINDFRGQITYSEMLTLVDKWPHSVRRRCREPTPFVAKKLIVTSSLPPDEIYTKRAELDKLEQLVRRFTIVRVAQKCSEGNTGTSEQKLVTDMWA